MGLDIVEFVMETEDAFGFRATDAEYNTLRTVGEFVELVKSKVSLVSADYCVSARMFCDVRRFMMETYRLPRRSISPATRLDRLLTEEQRRHFLETMARSGTTPVRSPWYWPFYTSPNWQWNAA